MKVTCESCQKVIVVPDEKLPPGRTLKFACPSCKNTIAVTREPNQSGIDLPGMGAAVPDTTPTSMKMDETQNVPLPSAPMKDGQALASLAEAMEDELEALVEEGSKRALVADLENLDRITPSLKKIQFIVTPVKNAEDALKKLQFNFYDLVVLNEKFDGANPADNAILKAIDPMPMDVRRKMFVVLVGKNFKTLDHMTAFTRSVDIVVNETDFANFELILKKAIKDREMFYRLFQKALADAGKD
jgi:predicted Zn finger-like uncharacterized protein